MSQVLQPSVSCLIYGHPSHQMLVFVVISRFIGEIVLVSGETHFNFFFFFQAEDGIRDIGVTGVQTCALPILLIESLQKFNHYYGDDFKVECPTGSGQLMHLKEVANEISNRLIKIWLRDEKGECAFARASGVSVGDAVSVSGKPAASPTGTVYLFHEYFHGDNGAGLGASHQTGWTGLVAKLIQ